MVEFEEVNNEVPPSQERLLDAQEIEKAAASVTRPTAKMHLEALAKKLRKESEALKRVEASRSKSSKVVQEEEKPIVEEVDKKKAAPKTSATPPPVVISSSVPYVPINKFAFDAGGYDSAWVTLYIELPGVGSLVEKENVTVEFAEKSFDLIIKGYKDKNYRLWRDNLENEIDTVKSKKIIKADKILVKLAKKKSEYGSYEHWSSLTSKKNKKSSSGGGNKENPAAGIMDMMKDMYDSGDDKMRKVIGETMMKQREGSLGGGMGGMGGMGGLGDLDMDV